MKEIDWTALLAWARAVAGLDLSDRQVRQLRAHVDLLIFWKRKVALVSQGDVASILTKHVADSLFAAAHCGRATSIADLGSGAGFPGIPIAIANPATRVCLIESRGKKVSFMEEACREAGVRNCEVFHGRIESAIEHYPQNFDVAVFRALAPTSQLLSQAAGIVMHGGRVLAMLARGRAPSRPDSQRIDYSLPDGTPRELVVFSSP